ncbi:MAG: hypothetical protein KatS3mg115_1759 [Candidatus Poribacteria bacterium]|nr:MAG: hypothetical protein KatS3mg115_1759 [Candidatus Poribacteria bacterium]
MKRSSLGGTLRRWFKTGLVSLLPSAVVVWLIYYLYRKLGQATRWVLGQLQLETYWWSGLLFPLVFLILAAALIIIVGAISTTVVGRGAVQVWDRLINRIPILNRIYLAVQQVVAAISLRRRQLFQAVVMIEYPYPGMYRLGFVTAEGLTQLLEGEELVAVLVPSSPNPMTGYLFLARRELIRPVNIAVEDAIKLIMSVGFVAPPEEEAIFASPAIETQRKTKATDKQQPSRESVGA